MLLCTHPGSSDGSGVDSEDDGDARAKTDGQTVAPAHSAARAEPSGTSLPQRAKWDAFLAQHDGKIKVELHVWDGAKWRQGPDECPMLLSMCMHQKEHTATAKTITYPTMLTGLQRMLRRVHADIVLTYVKPLADMDCVAGWQNGVFEFETPGPRTIGWDVEADDVTDILTDEALCHNLLACAHEMIGVRDDDSDAETEPTRTERTRLILNVAAWRL